MKKEDLILNIALVTIFGGILWAVFENIPSPSGQLGGVYTGAATTATVGSNVTVSAYLSVAASTNLSNGILFGSISTLPATDVNATANYNSSNLTLAVTDYYLVISGDSNVNVDFCIKADSQLTTSGGDFIALGNYTYSNSTVNNATLPPLAGATALTTSYVKSGLNIAKSNSNNYRFWLDVPAAQAAGTYNNTISFKGVQTGTSC